MKTGAVATKGSESATAQAATAMSSRAALAYAKGDLLTAQSGFEAAAQIYESLALPEPQAQARLSVARILAELGNVSAALQGVQQVLRDEAALSVSSRITAHGRAAALYLLDSSVTSLAASVQHLQTASQLCANACPQNAALQVLAARLALANNQPQEALRLAAPAVAEAAEQANALRVRATAFAALGQPANALQEASAALALDQAAGQPARVEASLRLMAAAQQALGNAAEAARLEALAARSAAAQSRVSRGLP